LHKYERCGVAFGSRGELALHERQHVRLQPDFRCSSRGAAFWLQKELREHSNAHKISVRKEHLIARDD
jgi:hypothetical protein